MEILSIVLVLVAGLALGAGVTYLAMRSQVAASETAAQRQLAQIDRERDQMAEHFESLASRALARSQTQFLELANERLGRAESIQQNNFTQRENAVKEMVDPIAKSLAKVEGTLSEVERSRATAQGELREHLAQINQSSTQLREETASLVNALRAPQVRGRWGEMQLRRVVEASGMLEHCDFTEQATSTRGEAVQRPDLVIHLAGGKNVVVDSKVAFSGYLEAMEARDEATRGKRLQAHARHLKSHIDQLGSKAYWDAVDSSPEFVVLFVPAEAFLNAALEQQPALFEHAFEKNVVIATPATLVALLRTVAYTWRTDALTKNAAAVLDAGRELHRRLSVMSRHFNKMGSSLEGAVKSYNETLGSLESRVLVSARRMNELKVTDEDLELAEPIDIAPRRPQSPEFEAVDREA